MKSLQIGQYFYAYKIGANFWGHPACIDNC